MTELTAILTLSDEAFKVFVGVMIWVIHRDLREVVAVNKAHDRELNRVFYHLGWKREKRV